MTTTSSKTTSRAAATMNQKTSSMTSMRTMTTRTSETTSTTSNDLDAKAGRLRDILTNCESVLVAFSGGVDSAYLAVTAAQVLGPRALAVTADSPSYPDAHRQLALRVAAAFGLSHEVIHTDELNRSEYRANPAN